MNDKLENMSAFKNSFVYRVEKGDDLGGIVSKFSTTKQIVISCNGLSRAPQEGELLVIEIPGGEEYIVKPHDTIESLSGGNKRRELEISVKNRTDFLYVGQKIYL